MEKQRILWTLIATLALGSSVGTSWAFDVGDLVIQKLEQVGVKGAEAAAETVVKHGVRTIDKTLTESSGPQTPPKNQSTPETTPPKADTARPIQENPKEGPVNKH